MAEGHDGCALDELQPAKHLIAMQFAVQADKGPVGDHIVRLVTRDPSGEEIYYYSKNILTKGGKASYEIPLALNAAPGIWKISARDVPSGTTKDVTVKVEPMKRLAAEQ